MLRRTLLKGAAMSPFLELAAEAEIPQNMLGAYGPWAASLLQDTPRLSFRQPQFSDVNAWRAVARADFQNRLLQPSVMPWTPQAKVLNQIVFEGLAIEDLEWQLPFGPPTRARFLKPAGATGKLPGVLALHDHSGMKFFGMEKISQVSNSLDPVLRDHFDRYYGGIAWTNELAKRGYAVLAHDTFTFGSRKIELADVPERIRPTAHFSTDQERYDTFADKHEAIVAKSLFAAGTSWPAVYIYDDQRALDYLASRPDVDASRLGCAGLSGGGLRTVMLNGLDNRLRCSCCAGMLTTWRDFVLNRSFTHTWMVYVPGLSRELEYAEILGLNVPTPVMTLNNRQDPLFTLSEIQRGDQILSEVYKKANAADRYRGNFYDGPHKFDRPMQKDAFDWFDKWLGA